VLERLQDPVGDVALAVVVLAVVGRRRHVFALQLESVLYLFVILFFSS
jgi:hypothetical protein